MTLKKCPHKKIVPLGDVIWCFDCGSLSYAGSMFMKPAVQSESINPKWRFPGGKPNVAMEVVDRLNFERLYYNRSNSEDAHE